MMKRIESINDRIQESQFLNEIKKTKNYLKHLCMTFVQYLDHIQLACALDLWFGWWKIGSRHCGMETKHKTSSKLPSPPPSSFKPFTCLRFLLGYMLDYFGISNLILISFLEEKTLGDVHYL